MIRVFNTADWHVATEFRSIVVPALDFLLEEVRREKPDMLAVHGDFGLRRGHLRTWEAWYIRTRLMQMADETIVYGMPGNHDDTNSVDGVDTLTAVMVTGDDPHPHPNIHIVTRPGLYRIPLLSGQIIQVLALPFPSPTVWAAGKDLSGQEAHNIMTEAVGLAVRDLATQLDPSLPSMFSFHGSIEGGNAGDSALRMVQMTSEQEVVIRQVDIPHQAALSVGGHLHLPQQVGRFVYTGAPCAHTFSTERIKPSYLEARFYGVDEDHGAWDGWDPNEGHPQTSNWRVRCARIPIPVAVPLYTLDLRGKINGDDTMADILQAMHAAAENIAGAKIRVLISLPAAWVASVNKDMIEQTATLLGAVECAVRVESQAAALIRAGEVDATIEFPSAMRLWLDFNPKYRDLEPDLITACSAIDASLTPEQRIELHPIDYKWLSLWCSNWKQYGLSTFIDFRQLPGLIAVSGPNMAGKSNLAELTAFVGWGAMRAKLNGGVSRQVEAIRNGQRTLTAGGMFEARGDLWRVDRSINRVGESGAKSTLTLACWRDGKWIPDSEGDADETKRKLESLLGSLDHTLDTAFSTQFDIDRILALSQTDFQRTLQHACNTAVYVYREQVAKKMLSETDTEVAGVNGEMGSVKKRAEDLAPAAGDLELAAAAHRQAESQLSAAVETEKEAHRVLDQIRHESTRLPALQEIRVARENALTLAKKEVGAATLEWHGLQMAVRGLRGRLVEAERATVTMVEVDAQVQELTAIEAEHAAMLQKRQQVQDMLAEAQALDTKAAEAMADLSSKRIAHGRLLSQARLDASAALSKYMAAKLEHEQRIARLQERLAELQKTAGLLTTLGGCNPHDSADTAVKESCVLLAQAIEARTRIPEVTSDLALLEKGSPKLDELQAAAEERDQAVKALEANAPPETSAEATELKEAAAQKRLQTETVGYDYAAAGILDSRLKDAIARRPRERMAALQEAAQTVEERRRDLNMARQTSRRRAQQARAAKAARRQARAALDQAQAELEAATSEVGPRLEQAEQGARAATVSVSAAQDALSEKARAFGAAESRVAAAKTATEELVTLHDRLADLLRRRATFSAMEAACGRKGIPFLILERALPMLEAETNRFLEGTELRVIIQSLAADDGKAEVAIRFRDHMGEHDRSEASGFGRAVMGMALRWGLAKVAAAFRGTRIHLYIQDEGFGAFDQMNLVTAQGMVREMAEACENLIVISHIQAIEEVADHRLIVVRDEETGSRLEGPGTAAPPEYLPEGGLL